MSEYFPELKSSRRKAKLELDIYNYATKTHFKNTSGVDTSKFSQFS